jgi:microcystin degradation protein MlrC
MRVAIGELIHESSTFAIPRTTNADFDVAGVMEGERLLEAHAGVKNAIGGFIDAGRDFAFEVVPTIAAEAQPSGVVTAETTRDLVSRLTDRLRAAHSEAPLEGVLLSLHGGMVSELDDDGESLILRAVREVVGPDLPVLVELDIHGNITQQTIDLATIVVSYDEYPHVDIYERGYECGQLLVRVVRGGVRPTPAIVHIPMINSGERTCTFAEPWLSVLHSMHDIERIRGVLNVSCFTGFAWADIPHNAFSVIVTTDNDPELARTQARRLAQYIWERRYEFDVHPVPVDAAVRRAVSTPRGPVVLADLGDSSGSGAPTDGTVLLESLLRLGARNTAVAAFADPGLVEEAIAAGEGATLRTTMGGKVDRRHGEPLAVVARVVALTDGAFAIQGAMGEGATERLGPTAVLEIEGAGDGRVQVVVTTNRYQPTDLGVFRGQGIEPTEQQILVVKSNVHFRAAFEPIAADIIEVDTPGLSSPRLDRLEYRRIRRPIYPFDRDMVWSASAG